MLCDMTPEEISYLATTFAVAVSDDLDNDSLRVLCSFFTNVIATLNLIINQRHLIEHRPDGKDRPPDKKR